MGNSTKPIAPVTPPSTLPENQDNKPGISRSIIISVLTVVIISGSFIFSGFGNQYQGLIKAKNKIAQTIGSELVLDEDAKAVIMDTQIQGSHLDETTFKVMKAPKNNGIDDIISYYPAQQSDFIFDYLTPNVKNSDQAKNSYNIDVTMQFCNQDFSSCIDIHTMKSLAQKKYDYSSEAENKIIYFGTKMPALIKDNPDKSKFRLKAVDPVSNVPIYSKSYNLLIK